MEPLGGDPKTQAPVEEGGSEPLGTDEKVGTISKPSLECSDTLYSPGSSSLSHHGLGASPPGTPVRPLLYPIQDLFPFLKAEADRPPPVEMLFLADCGEADETPEYESAAPLSVWLTCPDAHLVPKCSSCSTPTDFWSCYKAHVRNNFIPRFYQYTLAETFEL